ncbi:MAG: cobalamin-binding protein [Flavobacterium sp. BFFFF1]|uniref:ABC transporter substrate-binding protein n=1 Tax=Flavobacterium sp. BFFFF1 TaxID=2015557 RepID=UPI000BC938CB|nr:helical backbone metal receptor [Flavobacterium sp. BFFFF1]OYU80734.1 MAG: cobalamin-binding protein [Flavobacterium sp. BFFFF1]
MPDFTDQLGHLFQFEETPKRIVSLVPSQTELLYDLGLEQEIVGITKFCVHPFHLKSTKKIVGGTKKVHIEKIRLLQPDMIICNKEENTLEIVEALRDIAPVWVTNIVTLEDNLEMIRQFGALFNRRTEARKWIDKINFAQREFQQFVMGRPIRKVAYFIWKDPWMVAGNDNFIDEMLQLNGFTNIYANKGRYPEVHIQKLRIQGDPEIVFLSSEPYPFKEEDAFEVGRFTHHAKVVFVDGEMFSWYGSRVLKSFAYFRQLQNRIGD